MRRANQRPLPSRSAAFTLVATLAMVTLIAVILVAFLGSLQSERISSLAVANATRADLAAQAGVDHCIATLKAHFEAHPDSATLWVQPADDKDPPLSTTVLYFRGPDPDHPIRFLPLISGAVARNLEDYAALPPLVDDTKDFEDVDNSIDLNRARYRGDTSGWIGSPPSGLRSIRAPWLEMTSPDNPAKVIARYAYWVEDESFKLNLNSMGTTPRGQGTGERADEIPLQGLIKAMAPQLSSVDEKAQLVAEHRAKFPGQRFLDPLTLNRVKDGFGEAANFLGTTHSAALNLSRSGAKRININTLFQASDDPEIVRAQLDAFITPIRHELPDFGRRFYPTPDNQRQLDHEEIYLQKIAANVRDYVVPGSQPTLINSDGTVALGSKPTKGIEPDALPVVGQHHGGLNPVIAVGKKNLPFLQEFACRVTLRKFSPIRGGAAIPESEYQFGLDFYFEFWNMTPKPISVAAGDLGPNPFIRIYNLPGFDTGGGTPSIPEGGALEIPLPSSVIFPAGMVTVLTTDNAPPAALIRDAARVIKISPGLAYEGATKLKISSNHFRVNIIPRNTTSTDYAAKMVLGNDLGILESVCSLPIVRGSSPNSLAFQIHNDDEGKPDDYFAGINHEQYLIRGGSLHGNRYYSTPQITGDPRTNNEQLYLSIYDTSDSANREQSRYYTSGLDNPSSNGTLHVPANSSLGLPNANYVDVTQWPDPFKADANHVNTPMFIANAPMRSIGELGHVYDPARVLGPSGNIRNSRGGGRTFSIGQPDHVVNLGDPASQARERAAWRLTDLFTTTDEIRVEGLININGALRDDGAALRAALHGFTFSSGADADPRLAGKALEDEVVDALLTRLRTRLSKTPTRGPMPLFERGELSELLDFSPETSLDDRRDLYDRGREELFRRLVELITTRGSIFSVYAVGQSIAQTPSGKKNVTATSRLKITFELIPIWNPPLPEKVDPANPADRLRAPSSFKVKILRASP